MKQPELGDWVRDTQKDRVGKIVVISQDFYTVSWSNGSETSVMRNKLCELDEPLEIDIKWVI